MLPSLAQSVARLRIRSALTPLAASVGCNGALQSPTTVLFPGAPGQQARTTFILKRRTPPHLVKAHKSVDSRRLRPRHFVYELVEDTNIKPQEKIKILLLEPCEGVGSRGDVVEMKPTRARRDFLLPKRAVYASAENLQKYETLRQELDKQDQPSSQFALQVGQINGRSIHTGRSPHLMAPSRQKETARKSSYLKGMRSIITHHFNVVTSNEASLFMQMHPELRKVDKNRFDLMLKTLKNLGYNWQEIKNDKNVLFLLTFRVQEKHQLLSEFGIKRPRLHEVMYVQAFMKSEIGFLREYGIFKEDFDVVCYLLEAISELGLAPHIKEECIEKFSHNESASLGEIHTHILQQYLSFRFECSPEEFAVVFQGTIIPQWKSLVKYKGICDVLINAMKKNYGDIVKTPCLLDLDPENTYGFMNSCPQIGGIRFLDVIADIPQLLFLPYKQVLKWSDLLKKYKVQKFSFTHETLRLFKSHSLKEVEEKLKVLKNLQEWDVIKNSEQLFSILRRDDGVKRILDNLYSGTPVLSLHAARQMSPASFQVNNSTIPAFVQTKRFSNEIVSYVSNELDLEEEEVHDLLTSVAKSHLGLLNTKTVIELLFNFGFTREQIISGIQLISFEYRLVYEELQQFPHRPEAQPFDEWMDNPSILDLVSYFIKKNSPRLSHSYLD